MLKYSAKVFQVFHLARDLLPVSSAKKSYSLACLHCTAYRCQNLCNSYLYSFADRIVPLHAPYLHLYSFFTFYRWCSLCGLSHDFHRLQHFFLYPYSHRVCCILVALFDSFNRERHTTSHRVVVHHIQIEICDLTQSTHTRIGETLRFEQTCCTKYIKSAHKLE